MENICLQADRVHQAVITYGIMRTNIVRVLRIATIIIALLPVGISYADAQDYVNTPVSISKEKVKINGQVFYSHVVLERQTLFRSWPRRPPLSRKAFRRLKKNR